MTYDMGILLCAFVRALILTIIIELPVALLFGVRRKNEVLIVICVNTLTNPIAMLYYIIVTWLFADTSRIILEIPIEITVIAVEALIYGSYKKDKDICFDHPVMLAIVANLISWGTGDLIKML